MDAIVLAGGLGTRLRTVVADRPKPMALVKGRPFLEYVLDHWIRQGVSRFVFSVGYMRHVVMCHFFAAYRGVPLDYVVENTPLGTGGALLKVIAEKEIGERFLLLNGDTFFAVPLSELSAFHENAHADISIALYKADARGRYGGIEVDSNSQITEFSAEGFPTSAWINGGVYLANRSAFVEGIAWKHAERISLEANVIPLLLNGGKRLFGFPCAAPFLDIGLPEDYERAACVVAGG